MHLDAVQLLIVTHSVLTLAKTPLYRPPTFRL